MDPIIIALFSVLLVLGLWLFDKVLCEMEQEKIENDKEYAQKKQEEFNRLRPRRKFYGISWITLCLITAVICFGFDLERKNPVLFYLLLSLLFIYGGIGGLFARMVILKLPISFYSKLGYIFNSFLVVVGIYMILVKVIKVI